MQITCTCKYVVKIEIHATTICRPSSIAAEFMRDMHMYEYITHVDKLI